MADRQLPPVARRPISGSERNGESRDPAVEEALHHLGSEAVADRLEGLGIVGSSEAVGQGTEADPGLGRLAFGPLVPVDPHLGRTGKVRADLDEPRPEVGVEDVEVVDADPALLLEEGEPGPPGVPAAEDPLELLGGHDGHQPEATVVLCRLQVRPDVVELAVIPAGPVRLLQPQHGDVPVLGQAANITTEPVGDLLERRGRGKHLAQVVVKEAGHLTGHLQPGRIRVEVEPVHAFDLQSHMAVEHLIDVRCVRHTHSLRARGRALPARQRHDSVGRVGGGREGDLSKSLRLA